MSPLSLSAGTLGACLLAGLASAQAVNFTSPAPLTPGFGAEAVIVNDVDGLGRREVVVVQKNVAGRIDLMSSETGASLASTAPTFGTANFDAVTNIGDIDADGNDDIAAVFNPGGVTVLFTFSGATMAQIQGVFIPGPVAIDAMATLADLNGDGRAEVALGSAQTNQVFVADPVVPAVLYSFTDSRGGGFGSALAADGTRLAVGAPNATFIIGPPPQPLVGYVDVFNLTATGATQSSTFAAPAGPTTAQRFGNSLAAIGDLDGDGRSEFAVQAPLTTIASVFSEVSPAVALSTLVYPAVNSAGRAAPLADIDGDGRGDFAMSDGTRLFVFTTPTVGGLALAATVSTATFDGCVVAGPDVFQQGVRDLVTGLAIGGSGSARIEPIAMLRNLPDTSPVSNLTITAGQRPIAGLPFPIQVTTPSATSFPVALFVDFAPARNIAFGGGTAFINVAGGTPVNLGIGGVAASTPLNFTGITMPPAVFINNALVFQAIGVMGTSTIVVSNGLLTRLGIQ